MAQAVTYLFDAYPHLKEEWDYDKNAGLDPTKISQGSNKKVWWKCSKGHSKSTSPNQRRLYKCAYCSGRYVTIGENDLYTTHPELSKYLLNPEDAKRYSAGSNKKVMWVCEDGHEHESTVSHKVHMNSGCPVCSGKKLVVGVNDLATTHAYLIDELVDAHEATKVSKGSSKKLLWLCANGHEYLCSVLNKTWGKGCPYCSNYKRLVGYNDLAHCFPDIARELVDQSLGETLPKFGGQKVEWKCTKGHIYTASVGSRTNLGSGCPKCSTKGTSKSEQLVRSLLSDNGYRCNSDHTHRIEVDGLSRSSCQVDIELLDFKIVVEYDGSFFHKGRVEQDTLKTKCLLENGYSVIRLREKTKDYTLPLLEIDHPDLLQVPVHYNQAGNDELIDSVSEIINWIEEKIR